MRKLASIKTVSDILPIEGKDRIVLAQIDGWSVIVKKDEFQVGDLCIYCEIDSVLPERPEFEFLRSKGFRIKTMKMAGVISQGICFSPEVLGWDVDDGAIIIPDKNGMFTTTDSHLVHVGDDVTEIIGIKQYEATMDVERVQNDFANPVRKYPQFLMEMKWFRKLVLPKKQNKGFPSFISKTDETRIQNMPFILKDKQEFVVTEKVDGQSGTFCLVRHKSKFPFAKDKFEYIVCSRNLRLWTKDNSSYWSVSKRYNIENVMKDLIGNNPWVAIQGECIASNVQGNKYQVKDADLFVFNVIYPDGRMSSIEAKTLVESKNMKFVPILDEHYVLPDSIKEVLGYAHGNSQLYNTLREGVVFRSKDGKQSFKAVDPLFLLKHDE